MPRRLVYDVEKLAELPVGAVVQAHRDLGEPGGVDIVVRQPGGWFGAWAWEDPILPGLVVPCTVISIEPGPEPPPAGEWKPQADPTRRQPYSAHP